MNFGLEMLPEILNLRLTSRFLHFKTTFPNLECYTEHLRLFLSVVSKIIKVFRFQRETLFSYCLLLLFPKNLVHVISRKVLD